jgi:hypothetical protein
LYEIAPRARFHERNRKMKLSAHKRNIRGLQNIRTHSGSVEQKSEPYRVYLRIGALEMEKARRGKERQSAMTRVRNIDERFKEIKDEEAALLQGLEEEKEGKESVSQRSGGFKIRY